MIAPEEAWRLIADRIFPLPATDLARRDAAGRVLAGDLAARADVPAADVSAMDGFAVSGPVVPGKTYPVSGTIAAGDPPGFALVPPAVARIMTGAPVPQAADRVIPVEMTDSDAERVAFHSSVEPGRHIRFQGEVLRRGEPLLSAGTPLTPGVLAQLATHGYATVPVHRPPEVAVLATGDEVVSPETEPAPGQLRDSHTDFLLAAGTRLGLSFRSLGIAPDRKEALRTGVAEGLRGDVLLLCGGVSMGEFDLAEGVLAELGCHAWFDVVAIQPGKHLVFAEHVDGEGRRRWVFGLPGNPASVMVSYWLFVRPALRRLQGYADGFWHGALRGRLAAPAPAAGPRDRFLPAEIEVRGGEILVTPFPPKGSHDLAAFSHGTALLRIRSGSPASTAGEACEVLVL